MNESVEVKVSAHGPFRRFSFVRRYGSSGRVAQLSVYKLGDTLIDTGGSLIANALVEVLRDEPPRRILCTHQHEDHVGGVPALRAAYGDLPVFAPRMHVPLLSQIDRVPQYRAEHWGHPMLIEDALPYDAGEVFEIGTVHLEALETPGHTPGHIAFVVRENDGVWALTGDLYTTSPFVAWFESSAPCLLGSCRALASLAPEIVMLPTHGRVRADGRDALLALVEQVEPVAERVVVAARGAGVGGDAGAAEHWGLADALFGPDSGYAKISEGEWSHACFVRSVLSPVRRLPTQPVVPL